jgi:hypothetical protein
MRWRRVAFKLVLLFAASIIEQCWYYVILLNAFKSVADYLIDHARRIRSGVVGRGRLIGSHNY